MYNALLERLGPSYWWPGETPFEIAIGAILTQNTNWKNVEKAISNLKGADALSPHAIADMPDEQLAEAIRPSGYFNAKTKKLKTFVHWLGQRCDYDITALRNDDMLTLRQELLEINGIGPETADCILCYSLDMPSFVVDAYTRRMFHRHALVPEDIHYEELRDFFMDVLPHDTDLFNQYHALIVRAGKEWCRKSKPLCEQCPLCDFLEGEVPC